MFRPKYILVLFLFLGSLSANAAVELWLWQTDTAELPFVLPVEDNPTELGSPISHKDEWHHIKLVKTPYGYLQRAFPGQDKIFVNSIHHQAVLPRVGKHMDKPETHIAALSEADGVIEAIEFKRGLLVQFHPELDEKLWPILWTMMDIARERAKNRPKPRYCEAALT